MCVFHVSPDWVSEVGQKSLVLQAFGCSEMQFGFETTIFSIRCLAKPFMGILIIYEVWIFFYICYNHWCHHAAQWYLYFLNQERCICICIFVFYMSNQETCMGSGWKLLAKPSPKLVDVLPRPGDRIINQNEEMRINNRVNQGSKLCSEGWR